MNQISIILPTYNVEKYIARALDSCINQSFKDIEIIIVDDCGNDKSIDIAKEYASKDKRIKIIHNEKNLGTFASRNIGVLNSNSPFIMFLDPDDYLDINACEISLNTMLERKVDMIIFDAYVHRIKFKKFYRFKQDEFFKKNEFLEFLLKQKHFCWSVWAKFYKKDLILQSFKYVDFKERLYYGEDVLFNYINFMISESFFVSKECFYHYEFSEFGRYENKDKEILRQNYEDKKRSFELIKNLSSNDKEFDKKIIKILEKEILGLESRISS
ncbi:glycosyltransferase family 2 protein [Campylobacter lari]|uniref:Glycosyltransferase, family 2 n=1 Tax=Campylobacter lari (strain RM2100 / D67 / ATCC BAA-1060) TaxID=306263 RepID=B9KDA9_CAMLR|nr:glycosyltransferase family 2 protein [Campylobacter lari]ACM64548.1 glycosyltransferase, family 2 [Campylobacter lari RM2100]EAI3911856.1 glycosyltransferase family 2 protein [Campylobacter lari]EAI4303619.1 glycosyltransferase family 2 protein [Campylobacter lari]EAI4812164.1 glycosyltransferase family 2 protein [Campylobacter lari]EAI4841118.1 glycosyltransferase family 2 protein [Campylobacter lari]